MEGVIMTWNFRVFYTRYASPLAEHEPIDTYSIREVYYDPDGNITGITANDICPIGTSLKELQKEIQLMLSESTWKCLTPGDIPGYTYSEREIPVEETL
jgi:hypothetical protein